MLGLFSGGKKQRAIKAATEAISALCSRYVAIGFFNKIATSDPYIAGFLSTRIVNMCAMASQEQGLDSDGTAVVSGAVLTKVFGGAPGLKAFVVYGGSLNGAGDKDYKRGQETGRRFLRYATHQEDITADPNFDRAMLIAKSAGFPPSNDMSTPLVGLDQIWFHEPMEQRL